VIRAASPVQSLERIRHSFPYLAQCTYLNTASVGLSWAGEGAAAAEFYEAKAQGAGAMGTWWEKADATRGELAALLKVAPAGIEFVSSTTEALNLIALSLPLTKGEQVVVAQDEFPSVVLPWANLERQGVELLRVPVAREQERTQLLCEAVGTRTRVLAVSHVLWRTGTRVDLQALARVCRAHDCRLIVDGVQAVGALPVEAGVADAYCASVFKWLLSGFGLGFVALSGRLAAELTPAVRGYSNEPPSRSLRYGHLNYPGIFALRATLGYLNSVGWPRIHQRVATLAQRAMSALRGEGFEVLTPDTAHGGIVSFRHPRATVLVRSLADHAILVEDAAPIVRASAHFYNTEEDIDRFITALVAGLRRGKRTTDTADQRDPAA
jgi:cysteine desulfurase/selenocysteine lyase